MGEMNMTQKTPSKGRNKKNRVSKKKKLRGGASFGVGPTHVSDYNSDNYDGGGGSSSTFGSGSRAGPPIHLNALDTFSSRPYGLREDTRAELADDGLGGGESGGGGGGGGESTEVLAASLDAFRAEETPFTPDRSNFLFKGRELTLGDADTQPKLFGIIGAVNMLELDTNTKTKVSNTERSLKMIEDLIIFADNEAKIRTFFESLERVDKKKLIELEDVLVNFLTNSDLDWRSFVSDYYYSHLSVIPHMQLTGTGNILEHDQVSAALNQMTERFKNAVEEVVGNILNDKTIHFAQKVKLLTGKRVFVKQGRHETPNAGRLYDINSLFHSVNAKMRRFLPQQSAPVDGAHVDGTEPHISLQGAADSLDNNPVAKRVFYTTLQTALKKTKRTNRTFRMFQRNLVRMNESMDNLLNYAKDKMKMVASISQDTIFLTAMARHGFMSYDYHANLLKEVVYNKLSKIKFEDYRKVPAIIRTYLQENGAHAYMALLQTRGNIIGYNLPAISGAVESFFENLDNSSTPFIVHGVIGQVLFYTLINLIKEDTQFMTNAQLAKFKRWKRELQGNVEAERISATVLNTMSQEQYRPDIDEYNDMDEISMSQPTESFELGSLPELSSSRRNSFRPAPNRLQRFSNVVALSSAHAKTIAEERAANRAVKIAARDPISDTRGRIPYPTTTRGTQRMFSPIRTNKTVKAVKTGKKRKSNATAAGSGRSPAQAPAAGRATSSGRSSGKKRKAGNTTSKAGGK
jgi:hypothetical protein